jgi:hypothetical protein
MFCTVIDEIARPQLMYAAQPLDPNRVNNLPLLEAETDESVHRIPEGLIKIERTF